ncbi:glutamate ABC transporter substrate-binding protein [Plantactinospora sp. WMMB334]|uniref:glutamate ABC transporter substrate-binding protein n=1 Tax=Plantactinospora sp. WMMB334 TaxID=3404119 RepID=UPI003B941CB1
MTHRRIAVRLLAGVVAAVAAAGLAACGTAEEALPDNQVVAEPPRPIGMQDPAIVPTGPAASSGSCDPRASLRPSGSLPRPRQMPAGTAMATIVQRGRLIVGVDQNNYQFGFRDPLTGQLTGFDVDIAREIARGLFGDPGRIQFRAISSADRITAVQEGTVDLVVRTMTMNCERWQQVSFSTEYFTAGQRVLVNRGSGVRRIEDLRDRKVCAAAGSTSIRNIAAKGTRPVSVVNWTDCLVLLQQNQVVAVSTDDSILVGLAAQDPNTEVVGPRFSDEPYGVAISRESPELVRFVNGVLARIRSDGTWTQLYRRWLTSLGPAPAPPVARYRD